MHSPSKDSVDGQRFVSAQTSLCRHQNSVFLHAMQIEILETLGLAVVSEETLYPVTEN